MIRNHMPWLWLVLALGVCVLAACGGNAQPDIVHLTFTFTPVPLPTDAVIGTPSPTAPPTPTPTPVIPSPTSGPMPTFPLAPTLSPDPDMLTASFRPTIFVKYFTTDRASAAPGESVTLSWGVYGANRARIYLLNDEGERINRWDVDATGEDSFEIPPDSEEVGRFLLVVEQGGQSVEQSLLIPLKPRQCTEAWFFDPAPDTCPAGPSQISAQAEQTFEHGRMIWVGAQDRIYVIFEDGESPGWAQYEDRYQEGDPEPEDSPPVPTGLIKPIRGFGLVWHTYPLVQKRLGGATIQEIPFDGMYQADSVEPSVATLYLRTKDGLILALNAQDNTWNAVP